MMMKGTNCIIIRLAENMKRNLEDENVDVMWFQGCGHKAYFKESFI
jgi:hypothetical protein